VIVTRLMAALTNSSADLADQSLVDPAPRARSRVQFSS
jgi:hypothetical protein